MVNKVMIDNEAIGHRIREGRGKLGLSREEFAEIIELSDYYIGQLERGQRQMSLPVLVRVANCLHVSLDHLVFGNTFYNDVYKVHEACNFYKICSSNKDKELNHLINKCSPRELELVKKIIKTILPYTR